MMFSKTKGGEKMRKQGLIMVIAMLMAVILCGAVSAADSSSTGGGTDLPDVNSSDSGLVDPIIQVNVNYEYPDDQIKPEITVTDSNNVRYQSLILLPSRATV